MEKAGVIAHPPRTLHGRRIAIAGGGTAGHVQPALAVAEAYRAALPDVDIDAGGIWHVCHDALDVPTRTAVSCPSRCPRLARDSFRMTRLVSVVPSG